MHEPDGARIASPFLPAFLASLCLGLGACSSGGGAPPPPAPDAKAATPNFVGTWNVNTEFVSASPSCSGVLGQAVSGQLTITKSGSAYSVSDGVVRRPMTVAGNTATFSYSALGVTQVWTFVVYHNDSLLFGSIDVTHTQCQAELKLTGSRTSPARLRGDPRSEGSEAPPYEALSIEDHAVGSADDPATLRIVVFRAPPSTPDATQSAVELLGAITNQLSIF